jgi:hypothetical protein
MTDKEHDWDRWHWAWLFSKCGNEKLVKAGLTWLTTHPPPPKGVVSTFKGMGEVKWGSTP